MKKMFLMFSIGIAEKGSISLELQVHTSVGHASMPPRESSIGILSKAITRCDHKYNHGWVIFY